MATLCSQQKMRPAVLKRNLYLLQRNLSFTFTHENTAKENNILRFLFMDSFQNRLQHSENQIQHFQFRKSWIDSSSSYKRKPHQQ